MAGRPLLPPVRIADRASCGWREHCNVQLEAGSGDARDALDAWDAARQRGETVVLAAPTNDTVAQLNHAAQHRRIAAAEIDTGGRSLDAGGYRLHVGDEIATIGPLGLVAVASSLFPAVVVIMAFLVYGESIPPHRVVGLVLSLIALSLIAL